MRLKYLWQGTALYTRAAMEKLRSLLKYRSSEIAQFRLKAITHTQEYGVRASCAAFEVSRATLYRWQRRLKASNGQLTSLIPKPKTPRVKRTMAVDWRIIVFIRQLRHDHPRLGKEKIKPLLDQFCAQAELKPLAVSTIGKVIKRYQLTGSPRGRMYHDPASGFARAKPHRYRDRVRHSPKVRAPGYIEIDTITLFLNGVKRYV